MAFQLVRHQRVAMRQFGLYSPARQAPFVYRLGLKIFILARGVRLP